MKHIWKKGIFTLLMALMVAVSAPSILPSETSMATVEAAKMKINATSAIMIKGQSGKLKIKNATSTVTWSSNKPKVAYVNKNGKVTALKKGTAVITAKVDGQKFKCKIYVENPKISQTSATLTAGDTLKLKISGTSQTVKWASNKTSVATVNQKGKVTAKKAGTATITAKVGSVKYKCKVTVKSGTVAVTGISLNKTKSTLSEGDTLSLSATISPSNATDKTVTWSSSNSSVASVDSNGKVTAKKAGTATITAKSGSVKSECVITVTANPYNTLKDFLTSKGTKSGSDYSYIYNYDSSSTLTITYSSSSNKYTLLYEDSTGYCSASFSENGSDIPVSVYYDNSSSTFSSSITLTKSTYKRQTLTFTVDKNPNSITSSLIQGMSNSYVDLDFLVTQEFLNAKVGITLQDLGFTSYPS